MKTSDFDFEYPPELIAHSPAEKRDHSRLLVLDKKTGRLEHRQFFDIVSYLRKGDLLVFNNTRVIPANLTGVKEGGSARIEVLLAEKKGSDLWECLVKPGKRLKVGSRIIFGDGKLIGRVLEKKETGEQLIEFEYSGNFQGLVKELGEIPMPPYIKSRNTERYQTVYAKADGATAAPTAGLHFTPELIERIKEQGVSTAFITLHTGLATFRPVYTDEIKGHKMHKESFSVPPSTLKALSKAKRVIAVGTTSVRTLETISRKKIKDTGGIKGIAGRTDLFIYPGYKFKMVDAMITNFHFPRTTLVMLVSAFAGEQKIKTAYKEAVLKGYRLFSFGDAMFIK